MMGKQHYEANSAIVPMVAIFLITFLGFGLEYLFIIPIGVFVATWPDIDEPRPPKKWKTFKNIVIGLVWAIGLISAGVIWFALSNSKNGNTSYMKYALQGAIVLISYAIIYAYSKSKNGKFLFAHRGFTHTLIIPIILYFCFRVVRGLISSETQWISILGRVGCIIIMGIIIGIMGHIFMDLLCKAGVPILWPITKKPIHIGGAITSDQKAKDGVHISSKIYTYVVMAVCYTISIILIFKLFNMNIINMIKG